MGAQKTQSGLTGFGKHLYSVMLSHELRTFADLSRVLQESGLAVSRQAIANYANGNRAVPWTFIEAVTDALELDEDEQQDLAWHFAYGQRSGATG